MTEENENLVEEVVDLHLCTFKTPSYIRKANKDYYERNKTNKEYLQKKKDKLYEYRERMKDNEEYQLKQKQKRKEYNDRKKIEKLNLKNN
jgi:hypothetical protein